VPEAELDLEPAVALRGDVAGQQALRIDEPPVAEARLGVAVGRELDVGARIDRLEQARALEIGAHHLRDVATALRVVALPALERRHRDRNRLDRSLVEIDREVGARAAGEREAEQQAERQNARKRKGSQITHHWKSLGLKIAV